MHQRVEEPGWGSVHLEKLVARQFVSPTTWHSILLNIRARIFNHFSTKMVQEQDPLSRNQNFSLHRVEKVWILNEMKKMKSGNLLTYMGVFDLAVVSSVLPQLPADCNKWGLLWKPSVTGSYWCPFLHIRLPPAIYLSTNLYESLSFCECLQCL